jgi:hypothetical protein
MIFLPKKGDVLVIKKYLGSGYLQVGSKMRVEDIVTYDNPAMAGMFRVKMFGQWYSEDDVRRVSVKDKLSEFKMKFLWIYFTYINWVDCKEKTRQRIGEF